MKTYVAKRHPGTNPGEYGTEISLIAANTRPQVIALAKKDSILKGDIEVTHLKELTSAKTVPTLLHRETYVE